MEYALNLDFPTTNNVAEYEALIAGIGFSKTLRVKNIKNNIWRFKINSLTSKDNIKGST